LGHLINSETQIMGAVPGYKAPTLPAGWADKYKSENAKLDQGFHKKEEYLSLFDTVRAATLKALNGMTDADLDKPNTGRMADFAPTMGHLVLLVGSHEMMHGGQFTVVRRKLGKPVLF
jgi:uncharacterized damage-inducible protein DinB